MGGARAPGQGSAAIAAAKPRWLPRRAFGATVAPPLVVVVSGFIIHENTREFTKRQRRVRNGGRLGDLVERGSLIARRQWLSTRMRRWISPRSRLAAERYQSPPGSAAPDVQWRYYLPRLGNHPQKLTVPRGDVGPLPFPEGDFTSCACGERP